MDIPISASLLSLFGKGTKKFIPKGQVIVTTKGQRVNFVLKGYAKRYSIANNGNLGVQVIYGPGDIFPITLVYRILFAQNIYDGPEVFYYESITDMELISLESELLPAYINDDPQIYRGLLKESGKRLHFFIHSQENITLKSAYNRVAHQLLYFAQHFGARSAQGVKILVPLTQAEIASTLSLTRDTTSLALRQLRNANIIKTGQHIFVTDIKKLTEEAYK